MSCAPDSADATLSTMAAFGRGFSAALKSVFVYVLLGTYVGIGALSHDLGFGLGWTVAASALIWAAPGQVILVTALGSGASLIEAAVAISVSGVRFLPMVVSMLPMLRGPGVRTWHLVAPAHFTAVSVWIEAVRLLPSLPRQGRVAFFNGLSIGLLAPTIVGTVIGFYLAAELPVVFAAALLFLTPMSFLASVARNASDWVDRLALAFGLVIGPVIAFANIDFDLVWTGLIGGTLAYGIDRLMRHRR
jgi:predicted branched-subunit amino acid permease